MTFLRHPSCSSGLFQDFPDHYTLEWQKAISAYLYNEQILPFGLHGSRPIIGSNIGSIVDMSGDSPFIARRVDSVPLCPDLSGGSSIGRTWILHFHAFF